MPTETKESVNVGAGANVAGPARGSEEVLKKWQKDRLKLSRDLLGEMVAVARQHGGAVAGASLAADGDDTPLCPEIVLRFPVPPRPGPNPLDALVAKGLEFNVLTHGIPFPDIYVVTVKNPVIGPGPIKSLLSIG
jgi:hypothetical protein